MATPQGCDSAGSASDGRGAAARGAWSRRKLSRRYNAKASIYGALRREAVFILSEACQPFGDRVYSLKSRVKTLDSVAQKAERKQLLEPLDAMHDIVGLRVVCLYRSDLSTLRQAIEASFKVLDVDDKAGHPVDSTTFDYDSIHFKALLPGSCGGPRYVGLTQEPFEIQLRTLAMDSWATISHDLSYKKGWDIPDELSREFHAVAALLYLADKHFDDVYRHVNKRKAAAASALSAPKPALQTKISPYSLPAFLVWKFPEREHTTDDSVGDFAQALLAHGISTLGALNRLVDAGLPHTLAQEQQFLEADDSGEPFWWWDLAAARIAVRRADPSFEHEMAAQEDETECLKVLESMPIPFEVFESLVAVLDSEDSVLRSCDGNLTRTNAFLSARPGIDVDAVIGWMEDLGGYCDCEVLYNIAYLFNNPVGAGGL